MGFKGTPSYSAPEQFDPDTFGMIDHRTDIYQIGVVIYELLTDQRLFDGKFSEIINKILTKTPEPPISINPQIPKNISKAVLKALAKEKKDRWQYANDFMRAFKQDS